MRLLLWLWLRTQFPVALTTNCLHVGSHPPQLRPPVLSVPLLLASNSVCPVPVFHHMHSVPNCPAFVKLVLIQAPPDWLVFYCGGPLKANVLLGVRYGLLFQGLPAW